VIGKVGNLKIDLFDYSITKLPNQYSIPLCAITPFS
jgi:hypothetical protein